MIKADVILGDKNWKKKIKNPSLYIKKKLAIIKKKNLLKKNGNFTILLTNDKEMKKLNKKFRNKNKTTDVLSFPLSLKISKHIYYGDIAISFEIINKRSKNLKFNYELDKMWVHGLLHLLGYRHSKIKDFIKMQKKEKKIIKNLYN